MSCQAITWPFSRSPSSPSHCSFKVGPPIHHAVAGSLVRPACQACRQIKRNLDRQPHFITGEAQLRGHPSRRLHESLHAQTGAAFVEPNVWLGDCHPLVEQMGLAGRLLAPGRGSATLHGCPVHDVDAMREFLRAYHRELLLPIELPAICRAWRHATRNEFRELAAFDRSLLNEPRLGRLAKASQLVGRRELRRFRPLKDVRFVQRYLSALEREEVNAWHTLVYGVTIWLFSLPLQQGLLGYARQVTRGFIAAASEETSLSEAESRNLFTEFAGTLSDTVPRALTAGVAR